MSTLRRRLVALTCAAAATISTATVTPVPAEATTLTTTPLSLVDHPGLTRLLDVGTPTNMGIARLDSLATAGDIAALQALGLKVQPMKALPLALVHGDVAAMTSAVTTGVALDVYPDERLLHLDTASSNETSSSPAAAEALRANGFTGKGITVGVIDSGCDATHPDLADHVVHNVQLFSPEYANQTPTSDTTLVVPLSDTPYSNTDIGGGHGTHVAGIIAADSTTMADGSRLGVAPDASLACFSMGQVMFSTAVLTSLDHILSTPGHFSIDVINNSWGNLFRQFDPSDPVNVATKALVDAGIVVVFAAGNFGTRSAEASVSPFSQAPWVISVAASNLARTRGAFSSNGLRFDNSQAVPIGTGGHTVALGDRIGITPPDLAAPGTNISSTCASTGSVIGPCPTPDNAVTSGTSMAAPHIAGAAAVLLQAQPDLTPAQVQQVLKGTATPMSYYDGRPYPAFMVGYGHVNLDLAVALVRSHNWRKRIESALDRETKRVLASDAQTVVRQDLWQYAAPPVTVQGTDSRTYSLPVDPTTRTVYLTVAHPTPTEAGNMWSWTATLVSPSGETLGTTTTDQEYGSGTAILSVPVSVPGTYTIRVTGDLGVSDPDTVDSDNLWGRVVFLSAAQVRPTL